MFRSFIMHGSSAIYYFMAWKICVQKTNSSHTSGNYDLDSRASNENTNEKTLFYALLIVNTVANFFDSAYWGFLDSGVIERCRLNPRSPRFGFQFFSTKFGLPGSVIGIFTANIFVDDFPEASVSCYKAVFIVYILFTIFLLILTQLLFRELTFRTEQSTHEKQVNVKKLLINA